MAMEWVSMPPERKSAGMGSGRRPCLAAVLALGTLWGCEVPVAPTEGSVEVASYIEGTLRVGGGVAVTGPAILFRFACDDPPPPQGTGSPLDFLVIPEDVIEFGEAPFIFPSVPEDSCSLLTGFVDNDRDFHYAYEVTSQATAGDLSISAETAVVSLREGDGEFVLPVEGVVLRADTLVPLEPPAFEMHAPEGTGATSPTVSLGSTVGTTPQVLFELVATPIQSTAMDLATPSLTVVFAPDDDGDGLPDDGNGDGLADILWPQVIVRRLDPSDAEGLEVEDPGVLLPGLVLPIDPADPLDVEANLVIKAQAEGLPFDGVTPYLVDRLTVAVLPLVVTAAEPLNPSPIEEVAASGVDVVGNYQVLVLNNTGQRWALPNALAELGLDAQGSTLEVTEED